MANLVTLQLPSHLKERLQAGHPWVYRDHVSPDVRLPSGSWVRLRCGQWEGYGLWDAVGAIAVRVFSTRQLPDADWLLSRVQAAWELRETLLDIESDAFRWLFGEGDGLPGITVDRYGDYAAVGVYMPGADALLRWLVPALREVHPALRGIVLRGSHDPSDSQQLVDETRTAGAGRRTSLLWGEEPPADLVVQEHGLYFYANLLEGQKTGLFLDHRENRHYIETISAARDVLNCFAYTGAFSLYALRGGARSVISNDIGKGLDAAAAANITLNSLNSARHSFVTADSFELLQSYVEQGRTFDLIILDPPSFAKRKESRYAAQRAYARLNALAMRCVTPGGLLATASCTSQVGPEAFKEAVAAGASQAGKLFQIVHEAGQPPDHPVPAHFPEGRYLKFVVGRVTDRV